MAKIPADLAKKFAETKASGGGNNIRHGSYVLMIKKWWYEQKNSGRCFLHEFIVVEAEKQVVYEGEKKVEVAPNDVGSDCSVVNNLDGKGKLSALANEKQITIGLFGLREEDVSEEQFESTIQDVTREQDEVVEEDGQKVTKIAQPTAGMVVRCITYPKEVRSAPGKFITGLKWECIAPPGEGVNSVEESKKRLAHFASAKKSAEKSAAA